jgi:superfamily II DNA/RNA helicase
MESKKLKRRPRRNSSQSSRKRSGSYSSRRRPNSSRNRGRSRSKTTFDVKQFINDSQKQAREISNQPVPEINIQHSFSDFDLPEVLKDSLAASGFEDPTPIQDEAIPLILDGQDVVGIANTGTGKTLAFVLPIASQIIQTGRDDQGQRQRALIMCPTRELAQQVESEVAKLTDASQLYSVVCVGGMSIGRQIKQLQRQPEFVIGTPGRLKDLLDRGELDLSEFSYAVLDEADQMLDMGFVHDMRYILDHFKTGHQTLLFSATFSDEIKRLVRDFTIDAKTISVKTRETAITVDQNVIKPKPGESKVDLLVELLHQDETGKTIVFCRTKRGADRLSRDIKKKGINAESIHGDKPQRVRTKILNRFRAHSIRVLVATDVAARGLDIDDITHVINYDAPQTRDDYVHRIGRTGRAGKDGTAITFI